MAATTSVRSSRIRTISPLSIATSVPLPMAIPTSACASAGASLIPSPTKATTSPRCWRARTSSTFSCGSTPARTFSIPTCRAIAAAVRSLSPVSIITASPILFSSETALFAVGLRVSAMPMTPASVPPTATRTTVFPSSWRAAILSAASGGRVTPCSVRNGGFPISTSAPSTRALTPRPPNVVNRSEGGRSRPALSARRTIAAASGCCEFDSTAAAIERSLSSATPNGTISVTSGFPRVSVPVLSKTTVVSFSDISSASPFLMRSPSSAPRPIPTVTAVGVARPSAQGQATTRTEISTVREKRREASRTRYQTRNAAVATARTAGMK